MSSIIMKQIPPEPGVQIMGLENYGLSVFPGVTSSFEIPMKNGRYLIGLDDPQYKDQIEFFEKHLGFKLSSEEGYEWLEKFVVNVSHDITALDTNNFEDAFTMHVLKLNGGYGVVALNENMIEDAAVNTFKFAITDETVESGKRISKKEAKIRAMRVLGELYDGKTNRIVLIAKYLLAVGSGIGKDKGLALDKLSDFIEENAGNAEKFLQVTKLDPEFINAVVKVKDALFTHIIRLGEDNVYTLHMSGTKLGRTESEVIDFLTNSANKHLLGEGTKDDLPYSISAQLKEIGY